MLMRTADVLALTGLSRSTIYRLCKSGEFPPPVRIGKSVRWRTADIERHIASLPAGRAADVLSDEIDAEQQWNNDVAAEVAGD